MIHSIKYHKIKSIVVISLIMVGAMYSPAYSMTYSNDEIGISFSLPIGWNQVDLSKPREFLKTKYTYGEAKEELIMFGYQDVWTEMTEEEKKGLTRSEIDNSIMTTEDITSIINTDAVNLTKVSYKGVEYYSFISDYSVDFYGQSVSGELIQLFTIENGIAYTFQYMSSNQREHFSDFEEMMEHIKYPIVPENEEEEIMGDYSIETNLFILFALDLVMTFLIYSGPIIIYRFAIKRTPINPNQAKKITIIYGVISFIAMFIILTALESGDTPGAAFLLWSYINYRALVKGYPV